MLVIIKSCCSYLIFYNRLRFISHRPRKRSPRRRKTVPRWPNGHRLNWLFWNLQQTIRLIRFSCWKDWWEIRRPVVNWKYNRRVCSFCNFILFPFPLNWVGVCPHRVTLPYMYLCSVVLYWFMNIFLNYECFCFIICPDDLIKKRKAMRLIFLARFHWYSWCRHEWFH